VAVKQVRVSDLSGQQASEEQFAKLIVHEHPQYQGPITLDVLPEEIGELPESDQYVSIEVIQPGERSGQRALVSLDRFNELAPGGDMPTILMNAVGTQQPNGQPSLAGVAAEPGMARCRAGARWSGDCRIGGGSRLRKPPGSGSTLTRSRRCGQSAACRCWIRPTPGPRSATACRTPRPPLPGCGRPYGDRYRPSHPCQIQPSSGDCSGTADGQSADDSGSLQLSPLFLKAGPAGGRRARALGTPPGGRNQA
jgi:hypothetical protein